MSNSIEARIHNILLDIDPFLEGEYEEQSIIVAEAAANYRLAQPEKKTCVASVNEIPKIEEAIMIDSLLQAMNSVIEHDNAKYASTDFVNYEADGEVDYESVLRNLRFCNKDFGDMDIIGNDIDAFLENDREDDGLFDIKDCFDDDRENSLLYKIDGKRKNHRSDSLSR